MCCAGLAWPFAWRFLLIPIFLILCVGVFLSQRVKEVQSVL